MALTIPDILLIACMNYLERHLEQRLFRHAKTFKVVLAAGARQVGKSTLLEHVFPNVRQVVFDPVQDLYGAEVDVILDYNGKLFPIEFKASSRLSKHDTRGIQAFRDTYRNSELGVIVYGGNVPYRISEHAVAIPWTAV